MLWLLLTVAASYGGYVWGFRLIERALARSIDYSQTVEGTFVPDISGAARPSKDPATRFKLLFPPYVRISETAPITGSVTGSSSESIRASLDGGRLKVSPEGDVAPSAPAFNSWTWTITPTEMGPVFVTAKVRDLQQQGSPDTFLAKITVTDEFGFTELSQRLFRVLGAVLAFGIVLGVRLKWPN